MGPPHRPLRRRRTQDRPLAEPLGEWGRPRGQAVGVRTGAHSQSGGEVCGLRGTEFGAGDGDRAALQVIQADEHRPLCVSRRTELSSAPAPAPSSGTRGPRGSGWAGLQGAGDRGVPPGVGRWASAKAEAGRTPLYFLCHLLMFPFLRLDKPHTRARCVPPPPPHPTSAVGLSPDPAKHSSWAGARAAPGRCPRSCRRRRLCKGIGVLTPSSPTLASWGVSPSILGWRPRRPPGGKDPRDSDPGLSAPHSRHGEPRAHVRVPVSRAPVWGCHPQPVASTSRP